MSNLQHTPNENGVGVTIHDVNLAAGLAPHHTLQVLELLQHHRVVVFHDQVLTDDQLLDFVHRFGPPFTSDSENPVLGATGDGVPAVVVVGNAAPEYPDAYLGSQEVLPHSDHQWLRCPSAISALYALEIAEGSAPTEWTDLARAYSLLDEETRELIEDLRLVTYNPFYRPFGSVRAKVVDRDIEVPPGATFPHPLVRTHPVTREKLLFLNAAYEVELVGLPYEVAAPLLERLQRHLLDLEESYIHVWREGDVVLWDNRATVHYRPSFAPSTRRVLKRVSVGDGVPF